MANFDCRIMQHFEIKFTSQGSRESCQVKTAFTVQLISESPDAVKEQLSRLNDVVDNKILVLVLSS